MSGAPLEGTPRRAHAHAHAAPAGGDHGTRDTRAARVAAGIRAARLGHGANCSSIGSVVDTLFLSATVGGVLFAAIAAALAAEPVREVPALAPPPEAKSNDDADKTPGDGA